MLSSKSQYLSLFDVFFFSTKYFIIFGKVADQGQGPHSVHLLNMRFLVDLVVQLVMMSDVILYVDVKCEVKSCETQVVHVGKAKFVEQK